MYFKIRVLQPVAWLGGTSGHARGGGGGLPAAMSIESVMMVRERKKVREGVGGRESENKRVKEGEKLIQREDGMRKAMEESRWRSLEKGKEEKEIENVFLYYYLVK